MKQNLANRLAGGGFWALCTAFMCVEGVQHMREHGVPNPVVNLSDTQILATAAVNAFNVFCNVNMDGVQMNVQVEVQPDPQFADKYGTPITEAQWQELQRDHAYKQVALWRNGLESVFTMWTGLDINGCKPPHIFATVVVRFVDAVPQIQHRFQSTCLADAREAHRQVIELVRVGRL
jgi:hypothetical protein